MRIGNRLGGSVIWAFVAVLGVGRRRTSRRASHDAPPRWLTGWANPATIITACTSRPVSAAS